MSSFYVFDLGELKRIFEMNNFIPEGRSNWRKSYVNVLEKNSFEKLYLNSDQIDALNFTNEKIKDYKIVEKKMERKRKREEEDNENGDSDDDKDEKPEKKKRKLVFNKGEQVLLADFLLKEFPTFDNEILQGLLHGNDQNRFTTTMEFLCSQEIPQKSKTTLKLIKDFRDEISLEEIISSSRNDAINGLLLKKYEEKLVPVVTDFTKNYFENILNENNEVDDLFQKKFKMDEKFFDDFLQRNVMEPEIDKQKNVMENEPEIDGSKISILVKDSCGDNLIFRLRKTTRLNCLFNCYSKTKGVSRNGLTFTHDGTRLDGELSANDIGIEDGDIIDVFPHQSGGKPVILFYPKKEFQINSVEVKLNSEMWKLSSFYPKDCIVKDNAVEWRNFKVIPSGEIQFRNEKHKYLFWESRSFKKFDFQTNSKVYIVRKNELTSFLKNVLTLKLLKLFDVHDFITFWLGELEKYENNFIQFLTLKKYENLVSLKIDPKPDRVIKIFMMFVGFNDFSLVNQEYLKGFKIEKDLSKIDDEKNINDLDEKNLVVYEWGGMNLLNSKFLCDSNKSK